MRQQTIRKPSFEQLETRRLLDAAWDFGDAFLTQDPGDYPTRLADNGARHWITPGLTLGSFVDGEVDATVDRDALGDDQNGRPNDEDGILMPAALTRDTTTSVTLFVTNRLPKKARIDAWIDFNQDAVWGGPDELVFSGFVAAGWNQIQIDVPHNATLGDTYARFRLSSSSSALAPYGPAEDGEVEDYLITILPAEPDNIIRLDANRVWSLSRNSGQGFTEQPWPESYQRQTWTPVVTGDFSGDGATDIMGLQDRGDWWLMRNGGSKFVGTPWGRWTNHVAWTFTAADFNGDGHLDILGRESTGGTWWLARNTGEGFLNEYWGRFSTATTWTHILHGDFNGDGRPDVLGGEQNGTWWLAENMGTAFQNRYWGRFASAVNWSDVSRGDFNGDGHLDVVARAQDNTWWIWRGSSTGLQSATFWGHWKMRSNWQDVLVADFDDDGTDDVLGRSDDGIWWLAKGTSSGFQTRIWGGWSPHTTWSHVSVGRFDTDHLPDVIGRAGDGTWWVARNAGGKFQNHFWGRWSSDLDPGFVAVVSNFVEPLALENGLTPRDVPGRTYGDYARESLRNLMRFGTDRYGDSHSPMLMNVIDVRSRSTPRDPLPLDSAFRVIRHDRRAPGGGNLYMDQPTLRAFSLLSEITGEPKYDSFVNANIEFTTSKLVDDNGLFWWGWHRHYDAYRDELAGHGSDFHEIQIQQPMWEELWQVDPPAVTSEIEAIWKWHIVDKSTGENNRHDLAVTPPLAFAHSGGEYVFAFAFLYTKTGDPVWLDRAHLVANYFWNARDKTTNLVPFIPNIAPEYFDNQRSNTGVTGMYARALLSTFDLTGDPLFRDQAVAILKAYARYGYDEHTGRFWGSISLDGTPVPGPRITENVEEQYQPRGYIDIWQPYSSGKEFPLATAQTYAYAYELTGDAELLWVARRWADSILDAFPADSAEAVSWYSAYANDWAADGTYAENYGRAISFLLHMEQLTGESSFRDSAKTVANEAISKLYYRGFFRGHHRKPYHEAIDGVGYLLVSLLQLDQVEAGNPVRPLNF